MNGYLNISIYKLSIVYKQTKIDIRRRIRLSTEKAQTQLPSASGYRQTPTAQMNNFVCASLYYKKWS